MKMAPSRKVGEAIAVGYRGCYGGVYRGGVYRGGAYCGGVYHRGGVGVYRRY